MCSIEGFMSLVCTAIVGKCEIPVAAEYLQLLMLNVCSFLWDLCLLKRTSGDGGIPHFGDLEDLLPVVRIDNGWWDAITANEFDDDRIKRKFELRSS